MKYPWLYVGAKVVCVNGRYLDPNWRFIPNRPRLNDVLTVREVLFRPIAQQSIRLLFDEIHNDRHIWEDGEEEGSFGADRFRPVLPETSKQIEAMKELMRDYVREHGAEFGIKVKS